MRPLLALLAGLVGIVSGLVVAVALLVALGGGGPAGQEPCDCEGRTAAEAGAVVVATVADRSADRVRFEVESVERGGVAVGDELWVRALDDVGVAPWRRYRLHLFDLDSQPSVNAAVAPEVVGLVVPAGPASFGALPLVARLAWAAAPGLLVSTLLAATTLRRTRPRRR